MIHNYYNINRTKNFITSVQLEIHYNVLHENNSWIFVQFQLYRSSQWSIIVLTNDFLTSSARWRLNRIKITLLTSQSFIT